MASYNDIKVRQQIIIDHYQNPRFKIKTIKEKHTSIFSPVCVDELHLKLTWKNDHVAKAEFAGQGCAVFIASTDLMLAQIIHKNKMEINNLIKNYQNMIEQKDKYDLQLLGELAVFENVNSHLNRLTCASMIVKGLLKELNE